MDTQTAPAALPAHLAVVRRAHPEVDLVVLPPERPAAEPPPDDGERGVPEALRLVAALAARAWPDGADGRPWVRLVPGSRPGTVAAHVQLVDRRPAGTGPLDRLGGRLEEDGWRVVRMVGGLPRLRARREGAVLRASYAARMGTFLLSVTSDPVPVGRERARELVWG